VSKSLVLSNKLLAKRKAPSVQPTSKRLKQSRKQTHLDQNKKVQHQDKQKNKEAKDEQHRLLMVYRTERQRLEEQAKLVDEAIEAFVEELQDGDTT
jgi:hypothetical protein